MRWAACIYCRNEVTSDPSLPFFVDCSAGSREATELCRCAALEEVHQEINPYTRRPGITDHPFEPRGEQPKDRYYCGCRGWG